MRKSLPYSLEARRSCQTGKLESLYLQTIRDAYSSPVYHARPTGVSILDRIGKIELRDDGAAELSRIVTPSLFTSLLFAHSVRTSL